MALTPRTDKEILDWIEANVSSLRENPMNRTEITYFSPTGHPVKQIGRDLRDAVTASMAKEGKNGN